MSGATPGVRQPRKALVVIPSNRAGSTVAALERVLAAAYGRGSLR